LIYSTENIIFYILLDKKTKFCSACGEASLDFIQTENINWLNCHQCDRYFHLFCVIYDNSIEKRPNLYLCLVCNEGSNDIVIKGSNDIVIN